MSNQEVRDVLERAAKQVGRGWWQFQSGVMVGEGSCLLTAIAKSNGWRTDAVFDAACRTVTRQVGTHRLHEWNDTPGRLAIEVEDVLREAALSLGDSE